MLLPEPWDSTSILNDCRLCMVHKEKEMTDGHTIYDVPNIFKAVVGHFKMIDLESRAFIYLNNILEGEK